MASAIKPGSVKMVNTVNAPFKERENITYFQKFMRNNGLRETAMFDTDDLYDAKNLGSFITAINTFGGVIQGSIPEFTGPKLGVAVEAYVQDVDVLSGGGVSPPPDLSGAARSCRAVHSSYVSEKYIDVPSDGGRPSAASTCSGPI